MKESYSSCLKLMTNLELPVSLGSIFKDGEKLQYNSHIQIITVPDRILEKDNVRNAITSTYIEKLKVERDVDMYSIPVNDLFNLSSYDKNIVLMMKEGNEWYEMLEKLHSKFAEKYNVKEKGKYRPYIVLAEDCLETDEYLNNPELEMVLRDSLVHFEDFSMTYTNGFEDIKEINITSFNAVPRYFRVRELESEEE